MGNAGRDIPATETPNSALRWIRAVRLIQSNAVSSLRLMMMGSSRTGGGQIAFVNPPYSRGNIDKWVKKCYDESLKPGTIVVALLPVSTSANWFHDWVWNKAELRFIRQRVRFKGAKHTAPFSSVIAVYKNDY